MLGVVFWYALGAFRFHSLFYILPSCKGMGQFSALFAQPPYYPTDPGLSMVADAVEVVPSVQRGGVAELPEGLPQIVGAAVF